MYTVHMSVCTYEKVCRSVDNDLGDILKWVHED